MDLKLEQAQKWFFEGIEHFEGGRLEQARAAFEAARTLVPERTSVLGNLGITLFHLRRLDEAMPLLRAATAADPTYTEAWTCLGLACGELARWQEAVDALEKALALSSEHAGAWLTKGQCLVRLGRTQEALRAFDRALAVVPAFADAWTARGSLLRELHRFVEAAECFENALAAGGDPELNRYYLTSVTNNAAPPQPPRRYVESLFDDYAAEFESHLVDQLGYEGHKQLLMPLVRSQRKFHRALDLGCGTGLCGPLLASLANLLDGIDISPQMLKHARQSGLYRELIHADLVSFLDSAEERADLIVAADVFIYVGELEAVFRSIRRLLTPHGCFAFTVEVLNDDQNLRLLPSLRYAHSERYIRELADRNGFSVDRAFTAPIRYHETKPIQGLYIFLS